MQLVEERCAFIFLSNQTLAIKQDEKNISDLL